MAESLGVWIIGACGAVSVSAISGARALARSLAPSTALVTELAEFKGLDLVPFDRMVFGGHELRTQTTVAQAAQELHDGPGIISRQILDALKSDYARIGRDIRPGTAIGCGDTIRCLTRGRLPEDTQTPRQLVERLQADISAFKKRHKLRRVIVLNLASTEPLLEPLPPFYRTLPAFRKALRDGADGFTAGALYAYAALDLGCAYINFTPTSASDVPALRALALEKCVPHCGKDGKTGETLLKTALAPLFVARNLKVMSWEGYNILGNRDGAVLADPRNNLAKTLGKDQALRGILGDDPALHTRVRIDYCPSVDDWKTAWNFIHFQGFLGTKMIVQFIWQGCDSMLAAPLALDLVRLVDLAQRRGEYGALKHLSCFFKNPIRNGTHDFWRQWEELKVYVRKKQ